MIIRNKKLLQKYRCYSLYSQFQISGKANKSSLMQQTQNMKG